MSLPDPSTMANGLQRSGAPSQSVEQQQPQQTSQSQTLSAGSVSTSTQADQAINSSPAFPQLSASTEEILKRMSATGGTQPGWEAAREQVLQRMVTSQDLPPPPSPTTPTGRGRGRGRGGGSRGVGRGRGRGRGLSSMVVDAGDGTSADGQALATPTRGRGRGRARGGRLRGSGGRGSKRKRVKGESDSDLDMDDDGSDSESSSSPNLNLPSTTKSGRRVMAPTHFSPALKGPTRRRGPSRRITEASVCKVCWRAPSPSNNQIVFCDSCNKGYHQFCHFPPIGADVISSEENEWFCSACVALRAGATPDGPLHTENRIGGESLTEEEKREYLATLPHDMLVNLLLHASTLQPSLPLFPATVADQKALENGEAHGDDVIRDLTAAYPNPGHGMYSRLPPESEDLAMLVDEDTEAFSHTWREPTPPAETAPANVNASAAAAAATTAEGQNGLDKDGQEKTVS